MAYSPTTWVDGVTPVNAVNLNKLENGLAAAVGIPADVVVTAGNFLIRNELLVADTQPSFRLMGDGKIEWGPGGSTTPDTNLYRHAAGILATDGQIYLRGAGSYLVFNVPGDAAAKFYITANGYQAWGSGAGAQDTNLYRVAANILGTDDTFRTYAQLESTHAVAGGAILQAAVGAEPNYRFIIGQNGELTWGTGSVAGDTNLYRGAANILMTDDEFRAAGAVYSSIGVATTGFVYAPSAGGSGGAAFYANEAGDTQARFRFSGQGDMYWGPGGATAGDTRFYRIAAATLKVENNLLVGAGGVSLRNDGQIEAGTNLWAKADAGRLYFGTAFDTYLFRVSANLLGISGGVNVAGQLSIAASQTISMGANSYIYHGATSVGNAVIITRAAGDADNRFTMTNAGQLYWGGGTVGWDTNLYRLGVDNLATDDLISIRRTVSTDWAFAIHAGVEAQDRFAMLATGKMEWGPGTAGRDTYLYRYNAGMLKTDGALIAGTSAYIDASGGGYPLYFGAAADASISRVGANALQASGQFIAIQQFQSNASAAGTSAFYASQLASDGYLFAMRQATDVQWRMLMSSDGRISWGPGGPTVGVDTILYRQGVASLRTDGDLYAGNNFVAGANIYAGSGIVVDNGNVGSKLFFSSTLDTNLYRYAANVLMTDDTFNIGSGGVLAINNGGAGSPGNQIELGFSGTYRQYRHAIKTTHDGGLDAGNALGFYVWTTADGSTGSPALKVLSLHGDGKLYIGNAQDTNLYRAGADQLKTDDQFYSANLIEAANGGAALRIGAVGPSGKAGATFQADTNLYRESAGVLKTDGQVQGPGTVGQGLIARAGTIQGSNGAILAGTGFTCVRNSTGKYTITLSPALTTLVAVVGTIIGQPTGSATIFCLTSRSVSTLVVETRDNSTSSGALRDYDFSFIVTGT